ncbi:hypothetical protein PIROE2DRAFT_67518 [Piromyces sp. E2]|nr:hypothetical protein PIROE2DRAFT_67518 [Piromyces sp. E2]|eukprot:OUM61751.1 hypothetical protein PIROE2DRAFT_67518 [Piromyces sp. E2]
MTKIIDTLTEQVAEQGLQSLSENLFDLYNNNSLEYLKKICIICISNLGKTMESIINQKLIPVALRSSYKSAENILIQSDKNSNEPQLFVCELNSSIKDKQVFLVDAVISTGSVAIMAIKVLLDHNVKEENITFLSLLSSPKGLYMISKTFPKIKIITLNIDPIYEDNSNPFNIITY